jgi:hypothetical protein
MTSDRPAIPSHDDVEAFVKWMLKYGRDFAPLREPYLKNLDGFVDVSWRMVNEEITEHSLFSADALMMRGGEIAQSYTDLLQKHVDRRGGIMGCPRELQSAAVMALVKTAVMIRLAKYKYGAPISNEIVGPL